MAEAAVDQQSGNMKTIILTAVSVLLMVGFGVGGYLFGMKSGSSAISAVDASLSKQGAAVDVEASSGIGPTLAINDIIVNLLDDQESRYLKAAITLEMDGSDGVKEVEDRQPQVRDAILMLMSSKTFAELRDMQGKLQLRAELMERINGFLQKGKVRTIYFTDFVVQ